MTAARSVAGLAVALALVGCTSTPLPPTLVLEPPAPTTLDELSLVVQDPTEQQEGVSYQVRWTLDGAAQADLNGQFLVGAELTAKDQVWEVTVTPVNDDDEAGPSVQADVTVQNSLPTVQISLDPTEPRTEQAVTVQATASDDDGDDVTFAYTWLRNDQVETLATGPTLDPALTLKGEVWTVQVTPNDGQDDGPVADATVNIDNTPPVATGVALDPSTAFEDSILVAVPQGDDEDGDALTWTTVWSVNGEVVDVDAASLDGTHFSKGDTVEVDATPNDGFVDGNTVRSEPLVVRNTPPSLGTASIEPVEVVESTTVSCITTGWTDLDGDPEAYVWSWIVNGSEVATTATLTGADFDKGDVLRCAATPFDGEESGTAVVSGDVTVGNTPPVLASATLSTTSPAEDDTISVVLGSATDADGDSLTYTYSWTVNGSEVATSSTLTGADFDKGDSIAVTVTPNDGTDDGTAISSAAAAAVNTAPVISSIVLSPTSLQTLDTLAATPAATDADGDSVTFTYAWYVNGSLAGGTTDRLDGASDFDKGDEVYVVVTPDDGEDDGASSTSATVSVLNTAPSIRSVAISPSTATEATTLTCVPAGWSDDDGDSEAYAYAWFIDGTLVGTAATLTGTVFDRGDAVACEATPDDGEDTGSVVASAAVTVTNTPPTLASASLTPASPAEGDTIRIVLGTTADADGDAVTTSYVWSVNGTDVSTATTLTGADFDKGDSIAVTVTPSDGLDDGTAVTSASITAVNTAPVLSALSLSPGSPTASTDVLAMPTASDADGDTVTVSYAWYIDEVESPTTTDTLPGSEIARGQEVYVIATPTDGTASGSSVTSAVLTVVNAAPSDPSGVTLSPAEPADTDDLTCSWTGSTDADADPISYLVQWRVDGVDDTSATLTHPTVTATLDAADTAPGEVWSCEVVAQDGEGGESAVVASRGVEIAGRWDVLAGGGTLSCGIRSGELYCWGYNNQGQLGDGTTTDRATPTRVGTASDWAGVTASNQYACATNTRGELYCWGINSQAQLGDGTTTSRSTPTRVGTASDWERVAAGQAHTCATNTSGELYCWGYNNQGQLGDGTTTDRSTPARIGTASDWEHVTLGTSHTCATNTSGELYCWGYNTEGQLGDGSRGNRSRPTRVGSASDWQAVTAGGSHNCATNTSGELYCWGYNLQGQLGDGTTTRNLTPTRVGTASDWEDVGAGSFHSCATNTSGELHCWGSNGIGQLGDGTTSDSRTPKRVGSATSWTDVACGWNHSLGIQSSGAGLAWGRNFRGQLGDGTSTDRSSPVSIVAP